MFPIAPAIVVISMLAVALLGALVGFLSGLVCSLALKIGLRGAWKDVLLGAIAVPVGIVLVFITPWPENTIHRQIAGGEMTTTMNTFQHPLLAALVLAAILPALRRYYRFRQGKKAQIAH